MKKLLAMLLAGTMMFSVTACGNSGSKEDVAALDALTAVWDTYEENEMFAARGGDWNNVVDNAPGTFDITDAETLDSELGFPQSSTALIDEAASLIHMMNANTFTAGAFHVTDESEMEMLVEDLKDNILNRQWMCGFPDTLIIAEVGENTLVSAFGNAELIENFKEKITTVYEDAEIVCEESLAR